MNPYATDKIFWHPEAVAAFREGWSHRLAPIQVHLMPQNLCNQSCTFCAYRLEGYKNSTLFDDSVHIPWPKMLEILADFAAMGVKAVEVTGGGEPTAYPHFAEMFGILSETEIATALVTNGVLLDGRRMAAFDASRWEWARVSIDAGTPETYCRVRRVSDGHWTKAWAAVERLVRAKGRDEQRVGVGFVVTPANHREVLECCQMARDAGADNVRVSIAFGLEGAEVLTAPQVQQVREGVAEAKGSLDTASFQVVDLFEERLGNLRYSPTQDYDFCGSKDVLCVIEGSGKVYTCCTLAGDPRGLMGEVNGRSFRDLWEERAEWRRRFDVRKRCRVVCLYEKRNETFLELRKPPLHSNFV